MTDTTSKDTLTPKEAITANQLLKNLKKREDSLLDLTNNFSSGLVEFSDNVEMLRNIPHKLDSIIKDEFKACTPVLTKDIQDQINASITSVCQSINTVANAFSEKITTSTSDLENKLKTHLKTLESKADELSEAAINNIKTISTNACDQLNKVHNQATTTLNQAVDRTKDKLHDIERSSQEVLDKLKSEKNKINNNQWKWMLTVFVSSISTGILVAWLRTYW